MGVGSGGGAMSIIKSALDNLVRYWVVIAACAVLIFYVGGFVIQVSQIQTEQTALRIRIMELESRLTRTEDKINAQNIEVLTRLSRMEATLEEIRKVR